MAGKVRDQQDNKLTSDTLPPPHLSSIAKTTRPDGSLSAPAFGLSRLFSPRPSLRRLSH